MTEMTTTRTLEMVAAEIRTFSAAMLNNIIEIGRRLCEAKEMLPYGQFGAWVEENTGYSSSTANNFMRLFREYGAAQGCLFGAEMEDSQTFGKLSYTKALALLQLPAGEREEFVESHDVESMSTRELERVIRERDEAVAQFEASEKLHAELADKCAGMQLDLSSAQTTIRDLQNEIAELESRPVDVAVQEPDPAELQKKIDDAVSAAVKEAKAAAAEEKKKLKDKLSDAEKAKKDLEAEVENQKKAAADKEKQLVEQQAGIVSMEKERLEREIAELKNKVAMSDAVIVEFNTMFTQVQDSLNRMVGVLDKASDAETAGKLRAAFRKLLEIYGEKVQE